jgi:hypothetical protein
MTTQNESFSVEPTENNEVVETTKVKVSFTNIKYFNEDKNEVGEMKIIGKQTMIKAKKMVKELEGKNVLISKENVNEQFHVNTIALYSLKETE